MRSRLPEPRAYAFVTAPQKSWWQTASGLVAGAVGGQPVLTQWNDRATELVIRPGSCRNGSRKFRR
jgi:hypothetical protein